MSSISPHERARAYCEAIGRDPDEVVFGYANPEGLKPAPRLSMPLWRWMLGAGPETARGATEVSPKQRALRDAKRGGRLGC